MIYFLRNISIRLWISVALSMPGTFIIFPAIERLMPNLNVGLFCMILTGFVFILTGYIMNIAGERSIYRYINDAKNWERDGIFHKSEACYLKALQIFDSYLLTLLNSKKISLPLTGAIARFSLTAPWHNDHFDRATTFFLLKNPHETEVAHLWLKKIVKTKVRTLTSHGKILLSPQGENILTSDENSLITPQEENLLTLLAEMEPLSPHLVPLLAEIFTKTKRADFAAKRVFSIMERSSDCFGTSEYGQAEKIISVPHVKIEQEIFTREESEQEISALKYSEQELSRFEESEASDETPLIYQYQTDRPFSTRRRISRNIKITKRPFVSVIKPGLLWLLSVIIWVSALPMNAISLLINVTHLMVSIVGKSFNKIRHTIALHPELGNNIRRFIVLTLTAGVIVLFVNTLSHLFRTPVPPVPSTPKAVAEDVEVQVVPQKKFTIQVAAYLAQSHARQYLTNLEKKGVPQGTIASVEGGGKTWYLIRVGNYETKEIATEYGNKLKAQGIVKDFFVDNRH